MPRRATPVFGVRAASVRQHAIIQPGSSTARRAPGCRERGSLRTLRLGASSSPFFCLTANATVSQPGAPGEAASCSVCSGLNRSMASSPHFNAAKWRWFLVSRLRTVRVPREVAGSRVRGDIAIKPPGSSSPCAGCSPPPRQPVSFRNRSRIGMAKRRCRHGGTCRQRGPVSGCRAKRLKAPDPVQDEWFVKSTPGRWKPKS